MFINSYFNEAPIGPDTRIDRITAALNKNRDKLQIPQPIDLIGRLDPRWLLRKKDKPVR